MNGNQDENSDTSRLRWLIAAALVLAVPMAVLWWPGCRQYPPVASAESLQLMKLLYTACNTKDPVRLTKVEQGLEQLNRAGKLTTAERSSYDQIIAMAKAGEWKQAEDAAYRFAQDQVGVGHPAPAEPKPVKAKAK